MSSVKHITAGALKAMPFLRLLILGIDLLALVCGIVYLANPTPYLLWNLYGYVILVVLIGSIALAGLGGMHRYRYLDYGYLLLSTTGMLLIPLLNTLASSGVQNKTSQSMIVLALFNVIFLYGAVIAGFRIKCKEIEGTLDSERSAQPGRLKIVLRWIAVIVLCLQLPVGIFIVYILIGKTTGNMIEVFISEYAVFWGLATLSASVLIVRLQRGNKGSAFYALNKVFNTIVLAIGIIVCIICLIPLACVPYMNANANIAFREAFGNSYPDDQSVSTQYGFMKNPFSLQNYFFGTRTADYTVIENVLYYEGMSGKDAGIKLHFDVYMPSANSNKSGQNSVLVRIHGGSWTMGDKGMANYAETNKHFANLGYTVFDIQYGLNFRRASFAGSVVPANVKGDFDIDDMVRHIGIFTKYLADHANEYNANLDSVFISGGSAGGQLAVAAALGITSGKYTNLLDQHLHVRGLIPYYPANGLPPLVGIDGTPDLVDPSALVANDSPPCLIYHGTDDGIVPPKIAAELKTAYTDRSTAPCALLWMTFAGHGSDFYTPGYYNQVFTYYMERFMYQYR